MHTKNTKQFCTHPGTGWGHTQDVQKLFWGGTLGVRCTLAEPEENRKMTQTLPDHAKLKCL